MIIMLDFFLTFGILSIYSTSILDKLAFSDYCIIIASSDVQSMHSHHSSGCAGTTSGSLSIRYFRAQTCNALGKLQGRQLHVQSSMTRLLLMIISEKASEFSYTVAALALPTEVHIGVR